METASAAECNSESSTLVVLTSNQDVKHVVIPNSSIGQSKKKHFEIYLINITSSLKLFSCTEMNFVIVLWAVKVKGFTCCIRPHIA